MSPALPEIPEKQRLVVLGPRVILAFIGPDRERYLNGQVTQDVRNIAPDETRDACVTDAKGKLQAFVGIAATEDTLFVEGPPELIDILEPRLGRYLIADDAELIDVSQKWTIAHWLDDAPPSLPEDSIARKHARFGIPGYDLWLPATLAAPWLAKHTPATRDIVETLRITHGIPLWGKELTEGLLPPEAGLDTTAISYHKGCYIGQEVISRVRSAGKVNQHLVRLELDGPASEGAKLVLPTDPEKAVGHLTSVAPNGAALGFIRKTVFDKKSFAVADTTTTASLLV